MQSSRPIITTHRIIDRELGQVVYSPGQIVPEADALKYGIITVEELAERRKTQDPDNLTKTLRAHSQKNRAVTEQKVAAVVPEHTEAIAPEYEREEHPDTVTSGDRLPGAYEELARRDAVENPKPVVETSQEVEIPKPYAPKKEWTAFLVSQGVPEAEAKATTVKDAVAKYYPEG